MKYKMRKWIACLVTILLILQALPAATETFVSNTSQGTSQGYRDVLDIISGHGNLLIPGDEIELSASEGYQPRWTSSRPDVVEVLTAEASQTVRIRAVAPGNADIIAKEDGQTKVYSITVLDMSEYETDGPETAEPRTDNPQAEPATRKTRITIAVSGGNKSAVYNGEEQSYGDYTATSTAEGFDAGKVRTTRDIRVKGTNCGYYQMQLDPKDFTYQDDSVDAVFVVSGGWLKITPAQVTIKVGNYRKNEGQPDPEFKAVIEGLQGNDDPSVIRYTLETEADGNIVYIVPVFEKNQGNYKVTGETGYMTVTPMYEAPLYNIAKIGGKYYRLKKTTFRTTYSSISKAIGKKLTPEQYTADPYDFTDLAITIDGKTYIYSCEANAEEILDGANYYTVKFIDLEAVSKKIGAMDGTKPRWLIPEGSDRYNDPNETDSYHRNYEISLVVNKNARAVDQEAYTMLCVDGNLNYYRLPKSTIRIRPLETFKDGTVSAGEYILTPFDFTDVVLIIDGTEYKYSDHELTGEYDAYFTTTFDKVCVKANINSNGNWFKDERGWVAGAKADYGNIPNNTRGFHIDYFATTHEATRTGPAKQVTIRSDWPEGKPAFKGTMITMTAELTGFEEGAYTLQWEYSTDGKEWTEVAGETGITMTYRLDEVNEHYYWRVVAYDKE